MSYPQDHGSPSIIKIIQRRWTVALGRLLPALVCCVMPPHATSQASSTPALFLEVDFHQLALGRSDSPILKLINPAIDPDERLLYVAGNKSTTLGVVDIRSDTMESSLDLNIPGGLMIFYSGAMYMFDFSVDILYHLFDGEALITEESDELEDIVVSDDRGSTLYWNDYSFTMTGYRRLESGVTGFPTDWRQDLNAAYNIISIDKGAERLGEIRIGPEGLYYIIDQQSGKLYATYTGDSSLHVFDLNLLETTSYCQDNSCETAALDLGTSGDELVVDRDGALYMRNRLGGSTIYRYRPATGEFATIDNENNQENGIGLWPTAMALSRSQNRLFVLNHYDASIDIITTSDLQRTTRLGFSTQKPRTDAISVMAVNSRTDRIYAVWPELGILGVADGEHGTRIATLDLREYGFDPDTAANRGPGQVNLAVDEVNNRLFVHLYNLSKLLAFDGDTLEKVGETSIEIPNRLELALFSVGAENALFVADKRLNATTLEFERDIPGDRVIGYDAERQWLLVVESQTNGSDYREQVSAMDADDTVHYRLNVPPNPVNMPAFLTYDPVNHNLYVLDYSLATVKGYSLEDTTSYANPPRKHLTTPK